MSTVDTILWTQSPREEFVLLHAPSGLDVPFLRRGCDYHLSQITTLVCHKVIFMVQSYIQDHLKCYIQIHGYDIRQCQILSLKYESFYTVLKIILKMI